MGYLQNRSIGRKFPGRTIYRTEKPLALGKTGVILSAVSSLHLVAVKLTKRQLSALDDEVKRQRRDTFKTSASRSSVLREALEKMVKRVQAK
jgi:hypothetical protein